jgi:hypothetical protein
MNPASRWRLDLARQIATWYADRPGVQMIVLGGSVSHGTADEYSDLDIIVYWDQLDLPWLQTTPLAPTGADRFTFNSTAPTDIAIEQYFIGTLKVDVGHIPMSWWSTEVAAVLEHADTSPDKQGMLAGFLDAFVLTGQPIYQHWHHQIATYPDALALRMVEQHLFFYPLWVLSQQGLARGELLIFHDILNQTIKNILGVLAGLNRIYLSTDKPKHLVQTLHRLPLSPPNAAERIPALLTIPREAVPPALNTLIPELLDLVETHLPQADVPRARRRFNIAVQPCFDPPAFTSKQLE